jgi:2-keto-4-pentenoate hydratase/2-oxohepta-3-ene-1,7-dioic acid hydratase in catechol pathway
MPVDKIICAGKNYLDHAMELGDAVPEKPVLFLKPFSVAKQATSWNETLLADFPAEDSAVQPECEIVLRVAQDGFRMTPETARNAISAVTLGLDMTLRTRQTQLKKHGHPWTTAKVFKDAALLGPWIPCDSFENWLEQEFRLVIDGHVQQCAKGQDMMMNPENLLVYISQFFPLTKDDIIYTGTPAGVHSISKGTIAELRWGKYCYCVKWK